MATKDYFSELLNARLREQSAYLQQQMAKGIAEQDARIDRRFAEFEASINKRFTEHDLRFAEIDRTLLLHTWMLGFMMIAFVVPQLQAWFG